MQNYYKYLALSDRDESWGISVVNAGCTRIPLDHPYPPPGHPAHHHFNWNQGRVLQEYQLIYITKGGGTFETASSGVQEVRAGSLLLLFPGEKHRYRPHLQLGWDEYWVGFKGPLVEHLRSKKFFSPDKPILTIGFDEQTLSIFLEIIGQTKSEKAGYQPLIGGALFYLLGRLHAAEQQQFFEGKDVEAIVQQAKCLFQANLHQSITPGQVAQELGVGYSRFRKLFKTYTGIAPNQYLIQLRIQKAKEWLLFPDKPIKEIAYELRFESTFYFSKLFKDKTGLAPAEYRKKSLGTTG